MIKESLAGTAASYIEAGGKKEGIEKTSGHQSLG
jgi:hypothetical protein